MQDYFIPGKINKLGFSKLNIYLLCYFIHNLALLTTQCPYCKSHVTPGKLKDWFGESEVAEYIRKLQQRERLLFKFPLDIYT